MHIISVYKWENMKSTYAIEKCLKLTICRAALYIELSKEN
jgi:hypothetical protein